MRQRSQKPLRTPQDGKKEERKRKERPLFYTERDSSLSEAASAPAEKEEGEKKRG